MQVCPILVRFLAQLKNKHKEKIRKKKCVCRTCKCVQSLYASSLSLNKKKIQKKKKERDACIAYARSTCRRANRYACIL